MFCSKKCSKYNDFLSKWDFIVLLLVRLTLGYVFIMAGYGKFGHLDKVVGFFASAGFPYPGLLAPFVAGVEVLAGALLVLGLCARGAGLVLAVVMCVALFTAHYSEISSLAVLLQMPVYLNMLLLLGITTRGAGCLSLDAFIEKKSK